MTATAALVCATLLSVGSGPALFERPVNVTELNGTCRDKGPCLSCDGLSVYFHSDRASCNDFPDIWVARRASMSSPFQPPERVLVNGGDPGISCDELTLYIVRAGDGPNGQQLDLWQSTRASRTDPWPAPVPVAELNTTFDELGPKISHDGLALYFASDRPGTLGRLDLWVARRSSKSEPFRSPVNLTELNSPYTETNATITHDGLTIYFGSAKPGGVGEADLYRATRSIPFGPFDAPKNLVELNTETTDKAPTVSGDGLVLLFRSERSGGSGQSDLYEARDARSGVVGLGRGLIADVLFVNGTTGGPDRTLFTFGAVPISISLGPVPFGPSLPNYALFGYFSRLPRAVYDVPQDVGALAFPAPFAIGGSRDGNTVTLCNNLQGGRAGRLGVGVFPAPRALGEVLRIPYGFPSSMQVTFQAIVRDDAARSGARISVTNAVTVKVN